MQNKRFMIDKIPVVPEEMMRVPNGLILTAGFIGSTAHVWLKVEEGDDRIMGLICLPNGGPYLLEETEDFYSAAHAYSFMKRSAVKLKSGSQEVGVAFHVFTWAPKAVLLPTLIQ